MDAKEYLAQLDPWREGINERLAQALADLDARVGKIEEWQKDPRGGRFAFLDEQDAKADRRLAALEQWRAEEVQASVDQVGAYPALAHEVARAALVRAERAEAERDAFLNAAKYDSERSTPASDEAHAIWARIIDKPHWALPEIQAVLLERDTLEAEVARLRGALEKIVSGEIGAGEAFDIAEAALAQKE